jgi:hypothetical protein
MRQPSRSLKSATVVAVIVCTDSTMLGFCSRVVSYSEVVQKRASGRCRFSEQGQRSK